MSRALLFLLCTGTALASQASDRDDAYDSLRRFERRTPVVEVAAVVGPSVVYIETETVGTVASWPFQPRRVLQQGAGTGVVVHEDGYVVTNFHVVKGARRITVSFAGDPVAYVAELLSYKEAEDLALLRITEEGILDRSELREGLAAGAIPDTTGPSPQNGLVRVKNPRPPYPAVRMGTSADLMIGEPVVAIGNPHGQEHTVSDGIVSGLHRNVQAQDLLFRNLIQTDASINLGNSGGPLLNIHGELIGINTVMNMAAENIGFAIPVDRVREVLEEELLPNAHRAWMGLEFVEGEPGLVSGVTPGGPADNAGLCAGDRIVSLGDRDVGSDEDWLLASLPISPGSLAEVSVLRAGAEETVLLRMVPWDKTDGLLWGTLGLRVQAIRTRSGELVRVTSVQEGGPAAETGVEAGDVLPAVRPPGTGGRSIAIRTPRDLAALAARLESGDDLEIEVLRMSEDLSGDLLRMVGSIRRE